MFKRILPSLFLVAGIALAQQAPQSQQQPSATFKKSAELVTVPVVVTDKSGKPVRGLTKDDFVIQENGKTPRAIATFEAVETASGLKVNPKPQAGEFSNYTGSSTQPTRITIIALDMVNTPFASQGRVKAELLKFLAKNLRGDEPTALLTITRNGVKQLHPFTSNPQLLITALQKVTNTQSNMEMNEIAQDNPSDPNSLTDLEQQLEDFQRDNEAMVNAFYQKNAILDTMFSLEQVAQAYSGLPGRKTLVWASSGFPFHLEDPHSMLGFSTEMLETYERTWRALNSANIAVYPIDAEGLVNPNYAAMDVTKRNAPRMGPPRMGRPLDYDRYQQTRDTMQSFAESTGGKPCLDRNDLATCFDRAVKDSDSYYMLAYYLPEEDRKPGWHKLKVTVNKKDISVRARSGFYVPDNKQQAPQSLQTELSNAFSSPLDYTGMQLWVRWAEKKPDPKDPERTLQTFEIAMLGTSLTIDSGDNNHVNLEVAALAVDPKMKIVGEMSKSVNAHLQPENASKVRQEGLRYRDSISVPKGKYTVKIVVRDNLAGKMGSVSVPLEN